MAGMLPTGLKLRWFRPRQGLSCALLSTVVIWISSRRKQEIRQQLHLKKHERSISRCSLD